MSCLFRFNGGLRIVETPMDTAQFDSHWFELLAGPLWFILSWQYLWMLFRTTSVILDLTIFCFSRHCHVYCRMIMWFLLTFISYICFLKVRTPMCIIHVCSCPLPCFASVFICAHTQSHALPLFSYVLTPNAMFCLWLPLSGSFIYILRLYAHR